MPKKSKLPIDVNPAEIKKLFNELNLLRATLLNRLNDDGHNLSNQWLQDEIDVFFNRSSRSSTDGSVMYWIKSYYENANSRDNEQTGGRGLSDTTIDRYKNLEVLFREFQGRNKYNVGDVSQRLANDFLEFLTETKNHKLSYARRTIGHLLTICRNAGKEGVRLDSSFEFIKMKAEKKKQDVIFLTQAELKQIEDAEIDKPYLQNARKWLLLGCSTGARVSDLLELTENHIVIDKGRRVFKYRQKKGGYTKDNYVPVFPMAEKVIEQGFPHKISQAKLRKYFKEVGKVAGIDTPTEGSLKDAETNRHKFGTYPKYRFIGTHTCRRSFCSNMNELGVPRNTIMKASGHSKESSLLKYIGYDVNNYDGWDVAFSES